MSLLSTLSSSLTGLNTAQRSIGVTANNVANANTEGYSRKQVHQSTLVVDGIGHGVQAEEATRIVDEFLTLEVRKQSGIVGRSQAISDLLDRVQGSVFSSPGEADRGLVSKLSDLVNAVEAAALTPENVATRSTLVTELDDMLQSLSTSVDAVNSLRGDVDRQIDLTVRSINGDIDKLAYLNAQFARSLPTAELLDQRDAALDSLASKIDFSLFVQDNDTIAIYLPTGASLLEYSPSKLIYTPASSVTNNTVFGSIDVYADKQIDRATGLPKAGETGIELVSGGVRADLTPELATDAVLDATQLVVSPLTTGRLQGLLEVRDRYLPQLADQIGELGTMLRYNVNKAHNDAVPSPLPTDLAGTRQGLDDFDTAAAAGDATGEAYVAVVDASGAVVGDIVLDLSTYATADDLATDLNTQLAGFGSASISANDSLDINLGVDGAGDPYRLALSEGTSAITYTDAAGRDWTYGFAHYFGLNDLVVEAGSTPADLAVRSDILGDSSLVSRVVLDRSTGTPVIGGAGDNRGLERLAESLASGFTTIDRGGLSGRSVNLADYVSDIVATQAVSASEAENRAKANVALADELQLRKSAVSGVNLDEELARLIIYQRAFTASARVMTATNELLDELMSIAR